LRGEQLHLVPSGSDFASPVMRAAARLHDHSTWFSMYKEHRNFPRLSR
jgi:hypothetical protein